jgi:hypothetical protein
MICLAFAVRVFDWRWLGIGGVNTVLLYRFSTFISMRVLLLLTAWLVPVQQILGQQLDADTVTRAPSASSTSKFWGVTVDLGSATINVDKLNTYFAPYTAATISREGVSQAFQLVLSDNVFGSGAFFISRPLRFPRRIGQSPPCRCTSTRRALNYTKYSWTSA